MGNKLLLRRHRSALFKSNALTSVHFLEGAGANRGPDVDVTGNAGGPGVEPVLVVGSQLLGDGGLHQVNPLGNRHLSGSGGKKH